MVDMKTCLNIKTEIPLLAQNTTEHTVSPTRTLSHQETNLKWQPDFSVSSVWGVNFMILQSSSKDQEIWLEVNCSSYRVKQLSESQIFRFLLEASV